jgi:hypothetical protein
MKRSIVIACVYLLCSTLQLHAQACCSGGTPLLGSLESMTTPAGTWQFTLTYDYNYLDDVLTGSQKLNDNIRRRATHSSALEISYGLLKNLSLTTMLSFVQQERRITSGQLNEGENLLVTRGIGDAIFLVKYTFSPYNIYRQREISFGLGPKLPLGKSSIKTGGILLPADMQPGTGAWDVVFWGYVSQGFLPVPLRLVGSVSYRLTGTNYRFGSNAFSANGFEGGYKFGNEFVSSLGATYSTNFLFDYSLFVRYRSTTSDQFSKFDIPNTGGRWFYLLPGINTKLTNDLLFRISGQVPLYRALEGTQLTTSYSIAFSLFYIISKNSSATQ